MLATLASLWAGTSLAAPDVALIATINQKLSDAKAVRLTTTSGPLLPGRLQATSAGVEWSPLGTQRDSGLRLVPWSTIARIEVRRTHAGAGVLIGGLVGLAASFGLIARNTNDLTYESAFATLAGGTVVGGFTGGLIGSRSFRWARIYPWYERNGVIVPH